MIKTVIYDERPDAVKYVLLPDGKADVWLRKNMREFAVEEDADNAPAMVVKWAAEEAYMRAILTPAEIEADLESSFNRAALWRQGDDEERVPSEEERISLLERENAELFRQLTDAQLALCELYESLI